MHWNSERFWSFFRNKDTRKLAFNFANYGVFQTINYLIPLITLPYIIRVIGVNYFGVLSFAQAVIYYLSTIVEYGFTITGVQLIAQYKNDRQKQSEIISAIFTIQTGFMLIGLLCLIIASGCFHEVQEYYWVYLFSFLILPAQILQALWFYIGAEEMHFLNFVNLVGRTLYTVSIFIFVRQETDYVLVPLLNGLAMLIAGIISIVFILKKFRVRLHLVGITNIRAYLQTGWHLFISNLAINLYRNSNVLILGLVANKEAVGIYSAGEKLIKALQSIFAPLTQTVFPYISRLRVNFPAKSIKSIGILLKYMIILTGIVTILVIAFSKPLTILFLGTEMQVANAIVKIGAVVIIFGVINYILGIIFMTNFDLKRQFSQAVFITGIVNLILCTLLSLKFEAIGTAIAFSFAEVLLCVLLILFIQSNRNKWAVQS